jgi:radical SAM protein with 4Fe4S-binding SPASM domain
MRVRWEDWGAWVRTDDPPALVAIDRAGLEKLGFTRPAASRSDAPLEVHVAVTSKCGVGCEGCYLDARPDGAHVDRAELDETIDALAASGVFTIAFGGGEPILREDLDEIARHARSRGLTPVVTTSGIGMTAERARKLRAFDQVNVSYDAEHGMEDAASRAIAMLIAEGVRVGVNVILTRATFPHLERTLDRARDLGAFEAQLLRYKPAGRAARLDYLAKRLSPPQVRAFAGWLREYCARSDRLRVRIDCALVPFLSTDPEIMARPEKLVRLGIFGCEAGNALAAVRVDGRTAPCSFSPDGSIEEFRGYVSAPSEPCASCPLRPSCRGGCKVVTSFVDPETRGFAPDPECPRVRSMT